MVYRRREDEVIHITVAGLGALGKQAVFEVGKQMSGIVPEITVEYEFATICNIKYVDRNNDTNRYLRWNDAEISAEKITKSMLILLGEPTDINFKLFHSQTISLLGKPECKRIAILRTDEATSLSNALTSQQLDHVFKCEGVMHVAAMTVMLIQSIYFPRYDITTISTTDFRYRFGVSERVCAAFDSRRREIEGKNIGALIMKTTARVLKENINPLSQYVAYVCVRADISVGEVNIVMDAFRKQCLEKKIEIVEEMLAVSFEFDLKYDHAMVVLMEK